MTDNPSGAVRPTIFMILWGVASFGLQWLWPIDLPGPAPLVIAGTIAIATGLVLMGWTQIVFTKSGTAMHHAIPVTALVTHGPFRFSRNPVYLGMVLIFVGLAVVNRNGWALVLTAFFVVALIHFTIRQEEDYLAAKFGEEYARYRTSVRRWL